MSSSAIASSVHTRAKAYSRVVLHGNRKSRIAFVEKMPDAAFWFPRTEIKETVALSLAQLGRLGTAGGSSGEPQSSGSRGDTARLSARTEVFTSERTEA